MKPFGRLPKRHPQLTDIAVHPRKKGQSLLEFALVLPILLLLILGLIEVGRLIFFYASVFSATREATRYGAAAGNNGSGTPYYLDEAGIRAAAKRVGFMAGIKDSDVTIWYDLGPDDDRHVTANPYPDRYHFTVDACRCQGIHELLPAGTTCEFYSDAGYIYQCTHHYDGDRRIGHSTHSDRHADQDQEPDTNQDANTYQYAHEYAYQTRIPIHRPIRGHPPAR